MDAVHRYEGTVNQVMGDGIMALFGARMARAEILQRARCPGTCRPRII
jgi:class 3 adenylate cyclase